jgi:hypothetical protein
MGAREYGALCKHYAEENDLSQSALARKLVVAFAVNEKTERPFDASAVGDIYNGKRTIDPPLYYWLNTILSIPQAEAEAAMLEHLRSFRNTAVASQTAAERGDATMPPWPLPAGERRRVQRRRFNRGPERRRAAAAPQLEDHAKLAS